MAKKPLLPKVSSLNELRAKAAVDKRYESLLFIAASNLGGPETKDPRTAYNWLELNAQETSERGVVGEINFCRDLVPAVTP